MQNILSHRKPGRTKCLSFRQVGDVLLAVVFLLPISVKAMDLKLYCQNAVAHLHIARADTFKQKLQALAFIKNNEFAKAESLYKDTQDHDGLSNIRSMRSVLAAQHPALAKASKTEVIPLTPEVFSRSDFLGEQSGFTKLSSLMLNYKNREDFYNWARLAALTGNEDEFDHAKSLMLEKFGANLDIKEVYPSRVLTRSGFEIYPV